MMCPDEETLMLLLDGGVPKGESAALEAHIEGCAACRTHRDELRELLGDLRAPVPLDVEGHVARVMRSVEKSEARPPKRPRARALGAGLTSALALAAGLFFFSRTAPHGTP